ncbi:pilus assembly protein N-terminal domain-containing protein [Microvirga sp. CF3062]|uniref:pilus assembly protein N-terminal domain-containing protein n=1 Tax=Microvirga sp. CF3062 TaxID=3110182 RepID=UPI002E797D61|nr:pilus assembly protein N-terminal domain-containing protein [Microvirga sp. CF3062]MEE1656961.1 pilus assembly protein N-terminal domain-containing protein [Microvirga sp. CF3062]
MPKSRQRVFAAAAFAAAAFLSGSSIADEAQLRPARTVRTDVPAGRPPVTVGVTLDFARILAFDYPARTIVIGNPNIVDGTLSDEYTIVLTGKAIGSTNMIVLGDSGQEVANLAISVSANGHQVTTVYHGTEMQIFSCSETCRLVPTVVGK